MSSQDKNLGALKRRLLIKRIKTISMVVLIAGFFVFLGWVVRETPLFKFDGIKVVGTKQISGQELTDYFNKKKNAELSAKILTADNIIPWLLIKKNDEVLKDFPRIHDYEIKKNLMGKNVEIDIREREEKNIWCSEEADTSRTCYWMDDKGTIFGTAPESEGELIRVIIDKSGRKVEMGKAPFSEMELANFNKMSDLVYRWNLTISSIYIQSADLNDIFFALEGDKEIYFNLDTDPAFGDSVIKNLKNSGEWNSLDYLDLRIQGKGFYKLK